MRDESPTDAAPRAGGKSDNRLVKLDRRKGRYSQVLTQREIIRLFKAGVYTIETDAETGQPCLCRGGRQVNCWVDEDGRSWVRFYWQGKRKQTPLAVAVWLSKTLNIIPKHFEIHHTDLDCRNDKWENLLCLHKLDHRKRHHGVSEEIPF